MKKVMLVLPALAAALVLAQPAFADECPALISQVDQLIQTSQVPTSEKEAAKALRDDGKALHEQGNDDSCVETVREALTILQG